MSGSRPTENAIPRLAAELLNGLLRFASIDWKEAKFPVSKAIDDLGLHLLHLFPAGRAPRGEEGKQHHVALQVGQGDRCVVEHSDREVRGLLSDADERGFLSVGISSERQPVRASTSRNSTIVGCTVRYRSPRCRVSPDREKNLVCRRAGRKYAVIGSWL